MKKHLNLAIGLSLAIHTVIFAGLPPFFHAQHKSINKEKGEKVREIEIVPQEIEKTIKAREVDFPEWKSAPPYIDNIMDRLLKNTINNLSLNKARMIEESPKGIVLSEAPSEEDLKRMPAYMDYYHLIRERIKNNAYQLYKSKEEGEIFLSFTLFNNGNLESFYLGEESVNSKRLRGTALKSVEHASPFPFFPRELKTYDRLRFNISICFKNK